MPPKVFKLDTMPMELSPFKLPPSITLSHALDRVLRLLSVGSKSFLTNKVDRSVTGLIAQQVTPQYIPFELTSIDLYSTNNPYHLLTTYIVFQCSNVWGHCNYRYPM